MSRAGRAPTRSLSVAQLLAHELRLRQLALVNVGVVVLRGEVLADGAALAEAFFALHPLQVESVAWISELKNTLSGVFFFAAVLFYLRFDGWNTAMSPMQPVTVEAYKVKLLPADGLPIITDRFGAMQWNALVDYDELRAVTQADGNFFRIRQV